MLDEALRLFGSSGYAATSLSDIAAAAEISKAGLLHHFRSKEELFVEVLRQRQQADSAALALPDELGLWEALRGWVRHLGTSSTRRDLAALNVAVSGEVLQMGQVARKWKEEQLETKVGQLVTHLEHAKSVGELSLEAPSVQIARSLVALADGLLVQWYCGTGASQERGATDLVGELRLYIDMVEARWGR